MREVVRAKSRTRASTSVSACIPAASCLGAASRRTTRSAACRQRRGPDGADRASGALRISHATYRHVRGVFDVVAQPPMRSRALTEPVAPIWCNAPGHAPSRSPPAASRESRRAWSGARPSSQRLPGCLHAPVPPRRSLTLVTVVGEAGVGKSRLLYEFENWADAWSRSSMSSAAAPSPHTQGQPYGLLRDVLAWRLQISDGDSMDLATQKLETEASCRCSSPTTVPTWRRRAPTAGPSHRSGLQSEQAHRPAYRTTCSRSATAGFMRRPSCCAGLPPAAPRRWSCCSTTCTWPTTPRSNSSTTSACVNRRCADAGVRSDAAHACSSGAPQYGGVSDESQQRIDLAPLDKGHSRSLADELLKKLDEVPAVLRELIIGGSPKAIRSTWKNW